METIFSSDLLLPVQIRLNGLFERIEHLDRTLAKVPDGLSEALQRSLERSALFRGLNAIQRSYEASAMTLCLVLDGSVPDDEDGWYEGTLHQLAGPGSGRVAVLPSDLVDLLREVSVDPDFDPVLELEPDLHVQRRRHAAALRAAPRLVEALAAIDLRIADGTLRTGCTPDPEFATHHMARQARAEVRERALNRALATIEAAFRDKGHCAIPFGSIVEGRVHGRSDLDLLVMGEVSREEERALWSIAESAARLEGVKLDLHFPEIYADGFLDRLKVLQKGQIVPLRDFVTMASDPTTRK